MSCLGTFGKASRNRGTQLRGGAFGGRDLGNWNVIRMLQRRPRKFVELPYRRWIGTLVVLNDFDLCYGNLGLAGVEIAIGHVNIYEI